MRIFEIANAEEQLGLLRVIIDNTWTAIAQQAERQRQEQLKQQAKAKKSPKKVANSSPVKRVAKPSSPQNNNLNQTQNPNSANQHHQPIVPSPEQNLNAYRSTMQDQDKSNFQSIQPQAITSYHQKWQAKR